MTSQGGPHLGLVEDSPEDFAAFERIVNRQAPGLNLRRWRHAEALLEDLNAPDP
ncbi:MAG: hypothetical protein JHD16_15740, partial [Solirubrobacteraceae bacterium]|nr:hypothetical protein [Solirubrobacteraceae bacterium]